MSEEDQRVLESIKDMFLNIKVKDTTKEAKLTLYMPEILYLMKFINLMQKQSKVIDEMANTMVGDKKILDLICEHIINKTEEECDKQNLLCDDCIKQYFYRKAERR